MTSELYGAEDVELARKWRKMLESDNAPKLRSSNDRYGMARLLENTARYLKALPILETAPTSVTANVAGFTPVILSMVRRMGYTLLGSELVGVQPMTAPTGLAFALRPRYTNSSGPETLLQQPFQGFTGQDSAAVSGSTSPPAGDSATNPFAASFLNGSGVATATGEGDITNELSATVDSVPVASKTRTLRATFSMEMAQDLSAMHGIDANSLFSGLLTDQITAEISYEILRNLYIIATLGSSGTTTPGTFDLTSDSDGRWLSEKVRTLAVHMLAEASVIMQQTRLGHGNFAVVDVVTYNALHSAGLIAEYSPVNTGLMPGDDPVIRDTNVASGVLMGALKVYRDDYAIMPAGNGFFMVGWKGASQMEAGMFYTPYVPLWSYQTIDPASGQPIMGFKQRYGLVANPLAETNGVLTSRSSPFYRITKITSLHI